MDLILVSAVVLLLTILLWKSLQKPTNFPPGPPKIPLFGSLPFIPKNVKSGEVRMSTYMKEKYGPIAGMYAGIKPLIFITDFNLVKELYKMDAASFRPNQNPFHELRFGGSDGKQRGLLQSSGPEWVEQRRFALRQLRDLGFGKSSMEDTIIDEVEKLANLLSKEADQNDGRISLNLRLNISIVNALWILLVGEELELEDPHLAKILQIFDRVVRANTRINFVMNAISPELTKKFDSTFHLVENTFGEIKKLIKPYVDGHKKTFSPDDTPRDFVDVYLKEVSNSKNPDSSFYGKRGEESLIAVLLDLFLAGTETTSTSLLWTILYMLHFPDIQEKVHQEIEKVVGTERKVSLDDRNNLPYTQAVLMESMRMASLVPNGLSHSVNEDLQFGGYTFPKNCLILASILDIHYDPEYWTNPDQFNPNRFYDSETNTYVPNERLIPFLIGKRFCLGQTLAEKEYFLFFVGLMQKFDFVPTPGKLPGIGRGSGVQIGTIRGCPVYDVILRKRNVH